MRRLAFVLSLVLAAVAAPSAMSAQLIDRNAQGVHFAVNSRGEALLSYRARGKVRHVLAWGAMNADAPTPTRQQVAFKLDYTGGWGKYRDDGYWKTFVNTCARYDGPRLPWVVTSCKATDGSYWAL